MTSDKKPGQVVPPGSTIGILGGGQLGRMLALDAAAMGYKATILCPEKDCPASQVSNMTITADYDDQDALDRFASACDVVTLEFENVPVEAVEYLAARKPTHPNASVLKIVQDRLIEKNFISSRNIATAPYRSVGSPAELRSALSEVRFPAVLKTRRFGYDGKGQVIIREEADMDRATHLINQGPCILEGFIQFESEVSVIVARSVSGQMACFDPVENIHENHILRKTIAPALISADLSDFAREIAQALATGLDLIGLLAVEFFVASDETLLVNELAPRPHNSGHWTLDACAVSQFEQTVRAICNLPLGSTERHSDAIMTNLLGDEGQAWERYFADGASRLHLYGKAEARTGRKMGHVTRLVHRPYARER